MDFYEAFDALEWSYIKVYEYFNFPEHIIKWVSVIYINIDNCIIKSGHMSEGFTVSKGVIQGCPLSLCVFVIAVELLVVTVRHIVNIKGITHIGVEKNNQFADETVLIVVAEDESLAEALKAIYLFIQISRL